MACWAAVNPAGCCAWAARSAQASPSRSREGRITRSGVGACGSVYAALSQR